MAVASEAPGYSLVGDLYVVTSGLRFHPQYDYLVSPAWYVPVGLAYAAAAYLSRHGSGKKVGWVDGGRILRLQMQLYNILQILVCGYMTWGRCCCPSGGVVPLDRALTVQTMCCCCVHLCMYEAGGRHNLPCGFCSLLFPWFLLKLRTQVWAGDGCKPCEMHPTGL